VAYLLVSLHCSLLPNILYPYREEMQWLIIYMFFSGQTRWTLYSFISFVVSCTCFGCYLHTSSGAQLQCTAIGFVSVENRGFSIKCYGGLCYGDLCVQWNLDLSISQRSFSHIHRAPYK
jgi:hypothetical protein